MIKTNYCLIKMLTHPDRFRKLPDGWIRDNYLNVKWECSSKSTMNFDEAQKYCKSIGARLPLLQELILLVNYSKYDPAVDADIFKNIKIKEWYWSTTYMADNSNFIWSVDFRDGGVENFYTTFNRYVLPCRDMEKEETK